MSICVNVDPTNPGQYFACCGLLELADRLWPGAEGWFGEGVFRIQCAGDLRRLLSILVLDCPEEILELDNGLVVPPLLAPLRFSFDGGSTTALVLDAWMTIRREKAEVVTAANPPWNFWSGQQTPLRIWKALREVLARQLSGRADTATSALFGQRELLTGRFGFDPGAAWTALDVGFSPNEQKMAVASSAAVEMLAAVGIQRFRPIVAANLQSFEYCTWDLALSPQVAAAAAAGVVCVAPPIRYRGRVVNRGSYAALGYSTRLRGGFDE